MHGVQNAVSGQRVTPAASGLEMVGHFLRTGTLPWWADRRSPDPVAQSLRLLCCETPPDLLPNLRGWVHDPAALARLVRVCADDDLRRLLAVLRPGDAEWIGTLPDTLCDLAKKLDHALFCHPKQVRFQTWQSVLCAAARPSPTERTALLEDIIRLVSTAFQWPIQTLIDALLPSSGQASRRTDPGLPQPVQTGKDSSPLLARLHAIGSPLAGLLTAVDSDLPAGLRADLHALLARLEQDTLGSVEDFSRWLCGALAAGALPHWTLQRWLDQTGADRSSPAQELRALVAAAMAASLPAPSENRAPTAPSRFNDADALSIDNAGLVILWPFLPGVFCPPGIGRGKAIPRRAGPASCGGFAAIPAVARARAAARIFSAVEQGSLRSPAHRSLRAGPVR